MTNGYPIRGLGFGGNKVRPIRWLPWGIAALLAGLAFGCPVGSTVVGTGAGALVTLMTILHPLQLRGYRFPEPVALRVAPDGLHVHLGEHGRWRPGTYLHLPWPAIAELTLIDSPLPHLTSPSLHIRLNLAGQATITRHSAAARRAIDADGCLVVPQIATTDVEVIRHAACRGTGRAWPRVPGGVLTGRRGRGPARRSRPPGPGGAAGG